MKLSLISGAFFASLLVAGASSAVVNAPVSIAYPISGSTNQNYFKVSFTVTCPGGGHTVKWGFDGASVGGATFYDNFNTQFLHKLPTGWHVLDVVSTCGAEHMRFFVS